MKRFFLIIFTFLLFGNGELLYGQKIIRVNSVAGICYAGTNVNRIYIPPPKEFFLRDGNKGADIKVYYTNFPSAPKDAFQYAVSILSSLLPENTSFTIRAVWTSMADNGILGSTGITSFYPGEDINAINPNVVYPSALAEKISGKKLNADEAGDMVMYINSKIFWNTGTNGNPPKESYDLVTVVLHELIHGIGIVDSFDSENSVGSYALPPLIYDTFIEDRYGYFLTDTSRYTNNTAALNTQLLGGPLYFRGPLLETLTKGGHAKIYAPSTWNSGSSISHLNEATYTYSSSALMTPFLAKEEVIHNPGDTIMSLLGDIGWINTKISHKPFTDTETNLNEVTFKTSITSDTIFNRDQAGLVYSFDNFKTNDTLFMVPSQSDDTFSINLTIPSFNSQLSYYFYAIDRFERNYKLPSRGQTSPFTFYIGIDTIKPKIEHSPVNLLFDKTTKLKLNAKAYDNIGVDTVYVEYKKNNGSWKYAGLKNDSLDLYSGYIDIKSLSLTSKDSVQYRIIAVDNSSSSNKKYLPDSDSYIIKPEQTFGVVEGYSTDFTSASSEYINTGFSITQPAQFTSPALHTKHPYESPEKDNASIEYTAVLRYPVKVDESGIVISFREIVLVEPGESGSLFGSPDFYDYVIVEATRDFGATWFPMRDGYDSRISSSFYIAYNNGIVGNNSSTVGTQELFQNRTLDIRTFDKFSKGDTLIIRFRLYSDPYAYGWGWAIEDLSIKSVAAGVDDNLAPPYLKVFPNPGNGMVRLNYNEAAGTEVSYSVINISGIVVNTGLVPAGEEGLIDITDQPPGIYYIVLKSGKRITTARYSKLR